MFQMLAIPPEVSDKKDAPDLLVRVEHAEPPVDPLHARRDRRDVRAREAGAEGVAGARGLRHVAGTRGPSSSGESWELEVRRGVGTCTKGMTTVGHP